MTESESVMCPRCGAVTAIASAPPPTRECPKCGCKSFEMHLHSTLDFNEELAAGGESGDKINDLPTREFARAITAAGDNFAQDVERSSGEMQSERRLELAIPNRQDSPDVLKNEEERQAVNKSEPEVCPRCGAATVLVSVSPMARECRNCGQHASLHLTVGIKAEPFLASESKERIGELPLREGSRAVISGGNQFAADVERSPDAAWAQRRFTLAVPYRRDANGKLKKREERDAVERILAPYNEFHKTDYSRVEDDVDDEDGDVIAKSLSGLTDLRIQVVVADATFWPELARSGTHEESASEDDLLKRMAAALVLKTGSYSARGNLVLVLDGPWATVLGTIDRFVNEYLELINNSGFREVWYSGRGPGNVVRRLTSAEQ